jgi:hypothetical protein
MRTLFIAMLMAAVPRLALACPTCFGQNDSPLAKGANMGIFFMLGVVGLMLAAFAAFFIYLSRRARMFARDSPESGQLAGSKGAAQC